MLTSNQIEADTENTDTTTWIGGIVRSADNNRKRRDVHGSTLRFASGDTIVQDNCGGIIVKDRHGDIVKTIDTNDRVMRYEWTSEHRLARVTFASGHRFELLEPGIWLKALLDGSWQEGENDFQVQADGTLRTGYRTIFGSRYYRDDYLDGSVAIVNDTGRITALNADFSVQKQRLYTVLDNMRRERRISNDQRQGVCDALHLLMRRVALEEVSEQQAAQTIFHICRLLESCGYSPLGAQVCYMLSNEILFFAALPDEADSSDGLSLTIQHLYRYRPEQVALLVADMSIAKRYLTMSGLTVPYVDELMHPFMRKNTDWSPTVPFVESNRFLRVVLVNIVDRARLAARLSPENLAVLDEVRRSFSTREFGRVFQRELGDLFEHVTGFNCQGLSFKTGKETLILERAIAVRSGHNASSEVA